MRRARVSDTEFLWLLATAVTVVSAMGLLDALGVAVPLVLRASVVAAFGAGSVIVVLGCRAAWPRSLALGVLLASAWLGLIGILDWHPLATMLAGSILAGLAVMMLLPGGLREARSVPPLLVVATLPAAIAGVVFFALPDVSIEQVAGIALGVLPCVIAVRALFARSASTGPWRDPIDC